MGVSKGKIEYLDVLNVIAMFAVVMLHANGCFWTYSTDRYWFEANIIESVMYFGVPVFFMISGATLLDYRERYSTKDFFIKRIKKTKRIKRIKRTKNQHYRQFLGLSWVITLCLVYLFLSKTGI